VVDMRDDPGARPGAPRPGPEAGFALPELLVVLVTLGILAAVSMPIYLSQRQRGYEAQLTADLRNAVVMVEAGAVANAGAYPDAPPPFTTSDEAITLLYVASGDRHTYCVQAQHTHLPASRHLAHVVDASGVSRAATCPAL
jgi:prepilin-type N-terminal cleavage/methylation domain-containing protein